MISNSYAYKNDEVVKGKVDWKGRPARKDKHGGQYCAMFVHVLFGFQTFATLAFTVNLATFFNEEMHFDLATSSSMLTTLLGTSFILSVVMACFADTFVGRYKLALVSAWIEFMGIGLLTTQAHFPSLKPPQCNIFANDPKYACEQVQGGNLLLLYLGLYTMAIGMAGVKAGCPTHGADQFDENDPDEAKKLSSFFNWLFLSDCIGGAFSLTLVVWVQNRFGWDWGFGVSALCILLGILVFSAGISRYRFHITGETNPLIEIIQVYIATIRNRKLQLPINPEQLYEIEQDEESALEMEFLPHSQIFSFLDRAAVQPSSKNLSQWKLCRVTQVEKAKIILAVLPFFGSSIIMSTCLAQLQTFSIHQGGTMNTRIAHNIRILPASLPIIQIFFLIIIVPIYDQVLVPLARRFTGRPTGITHLQRIGVGLLLLCISMVVAAIVEVKRKRVAESHGMVNAVPEKTPLPISTFWLSFQYMIFGIADFLTYIGLLEFFYSEAPKAMKSTATSFHWCSLSFGYFLSTILVNLVNFVTKGITSSGGWLAGNNLNRNHLNKFYWLLAVLSFFNFLNYLFWARRYKYKPQVSVVPQ